MAKIYLKRVKNPYGLCSGNGIKCYFLDENHHCIAPARSDIDCTNGFIYVQVAAPEEAENE
jgi:hypothetical protein